MNNFVRTAECVGRISVSVTAKDGGNAGFAGAKTCPSDVLVELGVINNAFTVIGLSAVEPLPMQLLGTLEPSMVALRLLSAACSCAALPFASMQKPTGEGTSNRLGSDSSNIFAALKQIFKKATFVDYAEWEVVL